MRHSTALRFSRKCVFSSLGKSRPLSILFFRLLRPASPSDDGCQLRLSYLYRSRAVLWRIKSNLRYRRRENALVKVLYDRSAVACGVLVYAVGCLVSGSIIWSFCGLTGGAAWNTASFCSSDGDVFSTDLYDFRERATRGTIRAVCGQCFSDHGFRCCDPTAYLPELFGKIGTFFHWPFGTAIIWNCFRNQRAGDKAADPHVCCVFAASVLWAKSGRKFWKTQNGGNIKRRTPDHRRLENQHFSLVFLQLKAWLKRGTSLLLLVSMLFVDGLPDVCWRPMPQSDNVTVDRGAETGRARKEVLQHLTQRESLFPLWYDSKEALQEDVIAGKTGVWFLFLQQFWKIWAWKVKNSVSYLCTPLTTKGEVARETFMRRCLRCMEHRCWVQGQSSCLLMMQNVARDVLPANYEKLSQKRPESFQVNVNGAANKAVDTIGIREKKTGLHSPDLRHCFCFDHICGIRTTFWRRQWKPYPALPAPLGEGFQMMGLLAAEPFRRWLAWCYCFVPGSRGLFGRSAPWYYCWQPVSCGYGLLENGYKIWPVLHPMFLLVLINLVFCPVLVDIAAFIPALKLRYLARWGSYLEFISL